MMQGLGGEGGSAGLAGGPSPGDTEAKHLIRIGPPAPLSLGLFPLVRGRDLRDKTARRGLELLSLFLRWGWEGVGC